MKRIKYLIILILLSFIFIPNIKAIDYGECISNYGSLRITGVSNNTSSRKSGNIEYTNAPKNTAKWSSKPVTVNFEIQAAKDYYITAIGYRIANCEGEITGIESYTRSYAQTYKLTLTVSKGYVPKFTVWGTQANKNVASTNKPHNGTTTINPDMELGISPETCNIKFWDKNIKTTAPTTKGATTNVEKIKVDEFKEFFNKYWTWVMIIMPIITIILIGIDLFKVIIAGDPESGGGKDGNSMTLQKVASNAIKRMIALVTLLLLPFTLATIFEWVGLPFFSK